MPASGGRVSVAAARRGRAGVAVGATMLLAFVLSFGLTGCSAELTPVPSDDDATDIGAVVKVIDNKFVPASVEIAPGQAVRWEFEGRDKHDVVSSDRSFVSELQRAGATYTHIFDESGDYSYTCSIHPEMLGVVAVSE